MEEKCFVAVPGTREYREVPAADCPTDKRGRKIGYVAIPPFVVHSKCHGSFDKPESFVAVGIDGEGLLVRKHVAPSGKNLTTWTAELYAVGTWHTIGCEYTTEGYRFNRKIRAIVRLLSKIAKDAGKNKAKVAKVKKDFEDRGIKCGICPVCFGDYVADGGKLVHHGYNRPGIGYIVGDCHGVGFAPFEVSTAGTESWLEVLKGALANREERVAELATLTEVTVPATYEYRHGRRIPVTFKVLTKGEDAFADRVVRIAHDLAREISSISKDIGTYKVAIAKWKPATFPRVG